MYNNIYIEKALNFPKLIIIETNITTLVTNSEKFR